MLPVRLSEAKHGDQSSPNKTHVGQNQTPFYNSQGNSRLEIQQNGIYLEAGDGADHIQAIVPPQKQFIPIPGPKRPLYKRKATWLIALLILVVILGVVAGVVVHEMGKNESG